MQCNRDDADGWLKTERPDLEEEQEPDLSDSEPETTDAAPMPDTGDPEMGRKIMEDNLRRPITVKKYGRGAGRAISSPENAGHGYDLYAEAGANSDNIYWPFISRTDWLVARWAKLRGPGSTAVSELLSIPGVSFKLC